MTIQIADSCGFCFGVKRAIELAEESPKSVTIGPLIHNPLEIKRLKDFYEIDVVEELSSLKVGSKALIRTHGIPKAELESLKQMQVDIVDATCPYVTKPQKICEQMSKEGYDIVIFGDINHPEVKGVVSYAENRAAAVLSPEDVANIKVGDKVAVVSQTTRKLDEFLEVVDALVARKKEVRVFNTICNATGENQEAAKNLSKTVDVMVVIGGKNSSNTKQLYSICEQNCTSCYLVESESDLKKEWFVGKERCGVTAGASTPDWIISSVVEKIREYKV